MHGKIPVFLALINKSGQSRKPNSIMYQVTYLTDVPMVEVTDNTKQELGVISNINYNYVLLNMI